MGVSLAQYRAAIGHFYLKCGVNYTKNDYYWSYIFIALLVSLYVTYIKLKLSNDVPPNPGPVHSTYTPIKIGQANVRSVVAELDSNYKALNERPPKIIELDAFCNENDIKIMGVSESWCKEEHPEKLVLLESLPKIFRRDRLDRAGGGLLLYASNDINIERLQNIEPENSEVMCFEFQMPNKVNKFVFLCLCYRPQDRPILDFCSDLEDIYDYTSDKGYYNVIFIGDFNCRNNEWYDLDTYNIQGGILKTYFDTKGLHQLVNFATRFDIEHNRSSCLDLIVTNEPSFVTSITQHGPIANSDHIAISFDINSKIPKMACFTRHVWNFKRGDFDKLNQLLATFPWDTIFIHNDITSIVDAWTDTFLTLAKECIPYTSIIVRPSDLPYMTTHLRSMIRRKDRLFKLWSRTLRDDHRGYYTRLRNETNCELSRAERNYIEKECDLLEVNKNSSKWWKTVKRLCCFKKTSNTIAPIANKDGILVYDAESKADIFNEFYAGVSTMEGFNDEIPSNNIASGPLLSTINILQNDVYELLSKLDTTKATGPDNIGNLLLKKCAPSISGVLTRIFNLSLTLGEFPDS